MRIRNFVAEEGFYLIVSKQHGLCSMSKADPVRVPPLAQAQAISAHCAASESPAEDDSIQPAEPHITIPLHSKTEFLPGSSNPQNDSVEVAAETAVGEAVAESSHSIGPGTVLRGRYLLGKVIGSGGMCTVFEGLDRQLVAQGLAGAIAVKLVNPEFRKDAASALGLRREFECMMKLQHPGMVRVFDLSNEHGAWFLTMELLSGETLARRLRTYLASQKALRILLQCARTLAYAHEQGVVHGDLKPGNIFLTSEGVRLLDFGSAWRQHEIVRRDGASATPAYASPQVLQGSAAEPRDDLFSLGCVAYELFAGQHPFNGMSSLEAQHSKLRPVWLPKMPARYFASIARMLAWERSERPRSVHEFLDSLAAADARYSGSLTLQLRPDSTDRVGTDRVGADRAATARSNTPSQPDGAHFVELTANERPASERAVRAFAAFSGGRSMSRERPGSRERSGERDSDARASAHLFKTAPISPPVQQPEPAAAPPPQAKVPTPSPVAKPEVESRKPESRAPEPGPVASEPRTSEPEPAASEPAACAPAPAGEPTIAVSSTSEFTLASEPAIAEPEPRSVPGPQVSEAQPVPEVVPTTELAPKPLATPGPAAEPVPAQVKQEVASPSVGTVASQPKLAKKPARQASRRKVPLRAAASYVAALRQPLHRMGHVILAAPQGIRHVGQRARVISEKGLSRLALYPAFKPQYVIAAVAGAVLLVAVTLLVRQAMHNKLTVQVTAERTRQMDARRERLAITRISFAPPLIDAIAMPELDPTLLERPARAAAGVVSFKSERVYVAPGQKMAVISLSREKSNSGGARVGWRAVPMSAKPGVDFELPDTQVVRFNEGQSVRTLYIPIKHAESHARGERRFQVQLQQMPGGLAPKGIDQVEVVIAGAAAD